jgi:hypothetical protein
MGLRLALVRILLLGIATSPAGNADRRVPPPPGEAAVHDAGRCAHAYDSYARGAQQIWNCVAGKADKVRFASPGGRSELVAWFVEGHREGVDEPLFLDLSGQVGFRRLRFAPVGGAEAGWRDDGRAVFLNISSGGANGTYDAFVVLPVKGRLEQRDLSPEVRKRFGDPMRCGEPPNVAVAGWLGNGNVLVAAEIVHHSFCDSYGTFHAYEVDPVAMRIVREYGQIEAKKQFRSILGSELMQAPDRCVRQPGKCTIAYLEKHPEQGW